MAVIDSLLLFKAPLLGIVEGLTEFLPVSSTCHLIIAGQLLHFNDEKGKVFEIVIQTGAILAIVWEYRARFGHAMAGLMRDSGSQRFFLNLAIAFCRRPCWGSRSVSRSRRSCSGRCQSPRRSSWAR